MKNQVYVCGTLYHIFISILKSLNRKDNGTTSLLIVNDHTPNLKPIADKLVAEGFFDRAIYVPFFSLDKKIKRQKALGRIFNRNNTIVKSVENESEILKEYNYIKDSEINLFYNLGINSFYFIIKFKGTFIRMLEDGLRNYNANVTPFKAFKRKYILRTTIGEGRDKEIQAIEVQHPEKLSKYVSKKGKKLDLDQLKSQLTNNHKELLLNIFIPETKFDFSGDNKILLITQPFSEDRMISEEQKIKLYEKLIKEQCNGYKIYIKPHPRELTNYKEKLSMEVNEIPRSFPLELFELIDGITFEKGITVFSSAIENINCLKEKIFLGKSYMDNNT